MGNPMSNERHHRTISRVSTAVHSSNTVRERFGAPACSNFRRPKMPLSWRVDYAFKATVKRGTWRNRSNGRAVPLSKIQTEILRILASYRDPESYVARATPLNRDASRYSADIGVFHDREERVAAASLRRTLRFLQRRDIELTWLRQLPLGYTARYVRATLSPGSNGSWTVTSDFFLQCGTRCFGYMLHPVDLAANKVMAAAGRREVRDLVDLVTVHETILPSVQ